ncbi:MAG: hypothetical protein R2794_03580 [Chitinophagales bacterium]
MRIVGNIPHPKFLISVFSWNERYIVKIEAGLFEQTYKFNQGDLEGWQELQTLFDEAFIADVEKVFREMANHAKSAAQRYITRGGFA